MNYSLLVMESTGMMKMATGEGSPLRQGAGTGSREVFGGGGTPDLSSSSMFLGYVGLYRRKKSVGGASRGPGDRGRTQGLGAPPISWLPRAFPDLNSKSPRSYPFQKSRCGRFHSVWTPFDIPFLRILKQAIKQQYGLASG